MLILATMMSGCFDAKQKKETANSSAISTQQEAAHAVAMVRSIRLDALAQGVTSSVGANQAMQATDVSYPINYSIHRDCNVSGTADTDGQKISDTEYNATNSFDACQQIPGIIVSGNNHVYAQLLGNDLYAELTENEIEVNMGSLYMYFDYESPIKFYSDKDFSFATIILDGGVALSENPSEGEFGPTMAEDGGNEDGYQGDFHDFNVTMRTGDTGVPTLELNGTLDIYACGKENFNIQTVTPLTVAANGTFSAGELNINGALFEYNDDKTVKVTLADGTAYNLPQGLDPMCTLESGSILKGSTRDAISHNFLEDVNITATTEIEDLRGDYSTASDTNGNFKFKNLVNGLYALVFEKNGYITAHANFDVDENVEENFGLVDLIPNSQADLNITFSGKVKDAQSGNSVEGATIIVHQGINTPTGAVVTTLTTDTNGDFSAEVPTGYYTLEISKEGYITSNNISATFADDTYKELTLTPTITASTAVIALSWGANPRDLDSHLVKTDVYHVYYGHTYQSETNDETASLDTDDTNGFGPETITLDNLDSTGHYKYYVYHYSGSETIATSDAVVTVNFGSETYTFRPPNQSGRTWTVFTIENGHLIPCTGTCIQ